MSVIGLPATSKPASVSWTLGHNVAISANPLGNTVQRIVRSGPSWRATLQWPPMIGDDAGILAGFLDRIARGDRWAYVDNPANQMRGTFGPQNLVTNGDFTGGTTAGWTADTNVTLSVNARRLKVQNSSGSPAVVGGARQNITMTANSPHVVVCDVDPGDTESATLEIRRASDSFVEATVTIGGPGRAVAVVTPTVAAMQVHLVANSDGHIYFRNISAHRCAVVNGASQTGNRLNIDGLPSSAFALLKAGEMFCVKASSGLYELKRLTDDLDSDSTGSGTLVFEPALRSSPADNVPVIFYRPFARFLVPSHTNAVSSEPPGDQPIHGFMLDAVEDVTA